MLGVSAVLGGDGAAAAAAGAEGRESGGNGGGEAAGVAGTSSGGFSEEDKLLRMEESERNSGGNRWPRQETLALLQIRSDMDVAFRDSSLKGPLWDEVSSWDRWRSAEMFPENMKFLFDLLGLS